MVKDIFVPVDLMVLREAIDNGDFSVVPTMKCESTLKPSIETILHALMPHPIVVHLHAIEVLAHLVRVNCEHGLSDLIDDKLTWCIVDYYRPGASLAGAINSLLLKSPSINIIFLKNHGVVIGGDSVNQIKQLTKKLLNGFSTTPVDLGLSEEKTSPCDEYKPVVDSDLHQLAINPDLFKRLINDWALYPDHIVFLGPKAHVYNSVASFAEEVLSQSREWPELVFIKDLGVFARGDLSKAKLAQLRCYYDVLIRNTKQSRLSQLSALEISELLNWDAEKHRILLQ
jgi:rhamnose utilization protein RhaD (predicted bifunctional aldolase and dehydrogenase)